MIKKIFVSLSLIFFLNNANGAPLGVTHMNPSPYTVPAGAFVYGTALTYGLTDSWQIGMNLYQMLLDIPNVNTKFAIFDYEEWAAALTFSWSKFDLENTSGTKIASIQSYGPGAVVSTGLSERVAWINGAEYMIRKVTGNETDFASSATFYGTRFLTELSWLYFLPEDDDDRKPRALASGISYDTTYELFVYGISHHWQGFQLGVHYYPKADDRKFLPIIAGGGVMYF